MNSVLRNSSMRLPFLFQRLQAAGAHITEPTCGGTRYLHSSSGSCGRGDRKTKTGKRFADSHGRYRPRPQQVRRGKQKFGDPNGLRRMLIPSLPSACYADGSGAA